MGIGALLRLRRHRFRLGDLGRLRSHGLPRSRKLGRSYELFVEATRLVYPASFVESARLVEEASLVEAVSLVIISFLGLASSVVAVVSCGFAGLIFLGPTLVSPPGWLLSSIFLSTNVGVARLLV